MNGIPFEAYTIKNVQLDNNENGENFIHEIRIEGSRHGLPTLVMVHGYMAGGL